jgi:hypothetical protein
LNESYKPYGFSFKLIETTRTNNAGWYFAEQDTIQEAAMFNELRVGDFSTLNAYFKFAPISTVMVLCLILIPSLAVALLITMRERRWSMRLGIG